jgi:hypothetical protein
MRRLTVLAFASMAWLACGSSSGGSDTSSQDVPLNPDIPIADITYDQPGDDVPPADDVVVDPDAVASTRRIEFLVDTSLPIQIGAKQPYTIRGKVVDATTGEGVPNVSVAFKIVKCTEGLGGAELLDYDSAMTTAASITEPNGRVDGVFLAGESVGLVYTVELTAKDIPAARVDLMVANMDCAKVKVAMTYAGNLSPAASYLITVLPPEHKCADLTAGDLPNPVAEAAGSDFVVGGEVPCVQPNATFTVVVTAKEACPFAFGCVENVATPAKDGTVETAVDLAGVDVSLDGAYTGTHNFKLTDAFPDCTGLTTAGECAAPAGLSFGKVACCYLGAIEGFFQTDAAGFATAMKGGAASWSGGKIPAGRESDFNQAVDSAMATFLAANTPAWVAQYAAVSKGALPAVRQVNLTSTLTLQAATPEGDYPATEAWTAYTLYWKVGCDPADPLYYQCGKATYAMGSFGGVGYTPVISPSTLTVARGAGNLFNVGEHTIAMNPGRLLAFIVNDLAANALTGGKIRDGIFKDGAAKNVLEAADLWIACPTIAASLFGSISTWFTGTQADLQTLCATSVDGLLAPVTVLQTAVTQTSSLKVTGSGSWTDTNCDLKTDRFQSGAYAGTFQPASGDPVAITGSLSATRN